ncbi:MAG: NADH:ubiquinone oxidoreductase [Chitinivibrionales bacterium]|nr:NADH:ubiquinone oxidoreductase [Chitinivibrionales bacterium]
MNNTQAKTVESICRTFHNDPIRLMDILHDVQSLEGYISPEAIDKIARCLSVPRVLVESPATFYAFFSTVPQGEVIIRLCDDIIDELSGGDEVTRRFTEMLGIGLGETSADRMFSLHRTPSIGMSDQAPAVLINDTIVTNLSKEKVPSIIRALRHHRDPAQLVDTYGDGNNGHPLVKAMVTNNIRLRDKVLLVDREPGASLRKALQQSPDDIIKAMKESRLRGRGGAGFPTGMKWDFTRKIKKKRRYIICNGDEGEPGTFKDRILLTEYPEGLFDGMTIAAYAVGAHEGILYLRAEYKYLHRYLEEILAARRNDGLLGEDVAGKKGFHFDIRIQIGAGAYICGEETSLLSSCEGRRGDPKTRPPFPTQSGYRGFPTVVNNVETFSCVTAIMQEGAEWFASIGSTNSTGTKLLSICGDCDQPGVYEIPWGKTLGEMLDLCGAKNTAAVQMGGAAGELVGSGDFGRSIDYQDLPTGGSVMVFDQSRDLLQVVAKFMEFFIDESCGYCTPCRVGNVLLKERLDIIRKGRGVTDDLKYLEELCESVRLASRCGLGQTSPNPVLSSLRNFRSLYEKKLQSARGPRMPSFDIRSELSEAEMLAGRESTIFPSSKEYNQ